MHHGDTCSGVVAHVYLTADAVYPRALRLLILTLLWNVPSCVQSSTNSLPVLLVFPTCPLVSHR